MDLKELLGEELYNQIVEKAGDNKLAVVSDGNWIPKEKFDTKNQEVKTLQGQIKDRDTQLTNLGKKVKDNKELTDEIDRLKNDNQTATQELQTKLDQQAFDFSLEKSLSAAKVRNPKAVKALLDTDSIKLDGEKLLGLDDQLKAIKESDGYMFEEDEPAGGTEDNKGKPKPKFLSGQHKAGATEFNAEYFSKMSYAERVKLKKEKPTEYDQLIGK